MKVKQIILAVLVISFVLSGCVSDRGLLADLGLQKSSHAPNIVLILTDDQDLLLDSMEAMPQVDALLAKRGTTFSNFFVNLPLCCPARATLLRGQFPHNHGVTTNLWPTGGFAKAYVDGIEQATFATALQGAGYRTALFGKYLNGYPFKTEPTYIPPGWDEWWAPITDTAYGSYGYQVNHNGQIEEYGFGPEDYITDVMAQRAVAFITNTTTLSPTTPFFLALNVYAPHSPAEPAPRHQGLFADAKVPQTPSFNEADVSDKPPFLQSTPLLTPADVENMDEQYRRRLQSLAAVDEAVAQLVQTLEDTKQLDNTYIVFASDNGYHMGEHRLLPGKGMPYEEDIHVPLIVRGPGVRKNAVRDELTAIIDLAPTFAEIAGTQMSIPSDGRSLLPLLSTRQPVENWRKSVLLEHYAPPSKEENETLSNALEPPDPGDVQQEALKQPSPDYIGIRTPEYKYIQRIGPARELYDLVKDPYELDNQWQNADAQFKEELAAFMEGYRSCVGEACREIDAMEPPVYRLQAGQ